MKHSTTILLLSVIALTMTSVTSKAAAISSHQQQVETLFKLTQMEKKVNESVDSVMQMQLSQNPQLSQHKAEIRAFFEKHMGWSAMKNDITEMYLRAFSEEELKAINDFYITPVGQKVINTLPDLIQQRNQLAMRRLQQNIGDLQKIVARPVSKQ